MLKKQILTLLAVLGICAGMAFNTFAGWEGSGTIWRYSRFTTGRYIKSSWLKDASGRWYYFDDNGNMKIGWVAYNGDWYFLNTDAGSALGGMLVGWNWIDGKCYYLDPDKGGAMAKSMITPDGYRLDDSGVWVDESGAWYHQNSGHSSAGGDKLNLDVEALTSEARGVIKYTNDERTKLGLAPLAENSVLMEAAQIRAAEIAVKFSHTRPDGSDFSTVLEGRYDYSTSGENIASGYANPQKVTEGWMNSKGHRENILHAAFKEIGVGCYSKGGMKYWVQIFGAAW